jgi:hypothetical protein
MHEGKDGVDAVDVVVDDAGEDFLGEKMGNSDSSDG